MKRSELTKASGFEPAIILKSIHDLERANLVTYNRQSEEVRLVKRLY